MWRALRSTTTTTYTTGTDATTYPHPTTGSTPTNQRRRQVPSSSVSVSSSSLWTTTTTSILLVVLILGGLALIFLLITASTCHFASVVSTAPMELLPTTSSSNDTTGRESSSSSSSLGIYCFSHNNHLYHPWNNYNDTTDVDADIDDTETDTDTMEVLSAIFLSLSIGMAVLFNIMAWYTTIKMILRRRRRRRNRQTAVNSSNTELRRPSSYQSSSLSPPGVIINNDNGGGGGDGGGQQHQQQQQFQFQFQSIIAAVAAITCIPIFIIYNNDTCTNSSNIDTSTSNDTVVAVQDVTCQFGMGSYLTIMACLCFIVITIMTQCCLDRNSNNNSNKRKGDTAIDTSSSKKTKKTNRNDTTAVTSAIATATAIRMVQRPYHGQQQRRGRSITTRRPADDDEAAEAAAAESAAVETSVTWPTTYDSFRNFLFGPTDDEEEKVEESTMEMVQPPVTFWSTTSRRMFQKSSPSPPPNHHSHHNNTMNHQNNNNNNNNNTMNHFFDPYRSSNHRRAITSSDDDDDDDENLNGETTAANNGDDMERGNVVVVANHNTATTNDNHNNNNNHLFCIPLTTGDVNIEMITTSSSSSSSAGTTTNNKNSKDDDDDADDIVTVEENDDDNEENQANITQRMKTTFSNHRPNNHHDTTTNHNSIVQQAMSSSLLYSTSIMMDNDDDDMDDFEDPILIFRNSNSTTTTVQNNDKNANNMIAPVSTKNDATIQCSHSSNKTIDHHHQQHRVTDALSIPNVSLLDTEESTTTTVHQNNNNNNRNNDDDDDDDGPTTVTGISNFDLGSLEPSTIMNVRNNNSRIMTNYDDINGDESILDGNNDTPSQQKQHHLDVKIDQLHNKSDGDLSTEIPQSSTRNVLSDTTDRGQDKIDAMETKKLNCFAFPKTRLLIQMCRSKPRLHALLPPRQLHSINKQRGTGGGGYRYLEDIEIDSIFQPVIMSPPFEIVTVRNGETNSTGVNGTSQHHQPQCNKVERSSGLASLDPMHRTDEELLRHEWNQLHGGSSEILRTYSDEPEPYLEFSDEELSDDDDDIEIQSMVTTKNDREAVTETGGEHVNHRRKNGNGGTTRRRRRNHSSSRSVASAKTDLSLISATIEEETAEDLYNDNNEELMLLDRSILLVRSRSVPNLATYYSTRKTNNEVHDEIHMTGIHHYRSAQIFPQSTTDSSSAPNHRRNIRRWNNNHSRVYLSIDNDSDQGVSPSLLSARRRRRRHQLWYNINQDISVQSVPEKVVSYASTKAEIRRTPPLFRTERAHMGIHSKRNDEPSTSSSSNNSADSPVPHNNRGINSNSNELNLLPSQKARMARFQRLQQQQQCSVIKTPPPAVRTTTNSKSITTPTKRQESRARNATIPSDETVDSNVLLDQPLSNDKNDTYETTISTVLDDSDDIYVVEDAKTGVVARHCNDSDSADIDIDIDVSSGGISNQIMNYHHHHDVSFGSSTGNDSYIIDLLDVQLAELNRPEGALIGPDEASM